MVASVSQAKVIRRGAIDMQVCVPSDWTDQEVKAFAEAEYPCGTRHGWAIRKEGTASLGGDPERQPCSSRKKFVHVILDA